MIAILDRDIDPTYSENSRERQMALLIQAIRDLVEEVEESRMLSALHLAELRDAVYRCADR
jgi:hypothetical protein